MIKNSQGVYLDPSEVDYLTTKEIKKLYNVQSPRVLAAVKRGEIKAYKQKGSRCVWYINKKSLEIYIEKRKETPEYKVKKEEAKKLKAQRDDLSAKIEELIKEAKMEDVFTFILKKKRKKGVVLEYPARTICSCDGEVYNTLMNWAYKNKIVRHKAFDAAMEKFQDSLGKFNQRPKEADNASMRYWKSKAKINEKKGK